jgi:hypothetical protein
VKRAKPLYFVKLWPYPRRLALFRDRAAYLAYLDKHCACSAQSDGHRADDKTHGQMSEVIGTNIYAVGIFDEDPATLVHELAHVCINLLDGLGMPITHDSSEAFCYLQGSLYAACANVLWPTKEKAPCPTCSPTSSPPPPASSPSPSASRPGSSARRPKPSRKRIKNSAPRAPRSPKR